MRNYLKGALAAAMLVGGGLAIAGDDKTKTQQDTHTGGSGMEASSDASKASTEVSGTVIRADDKLLSVRNQQGESIPLKIDENTRFDDPSVKEISDLEAGQEVRASYSVEGSDNVATQVWVVESDTMTPGSNTGGSGMEQDAGTYDPATGGSGMEPDAGTYDPSTGGSGEPIEQPAPGDVNEPVDMQQ